MNILYIFNSFQNREIFNFLANRWRFYREKKKWAKQRKKVSIVNFSLVFFYHGDGRESDILSEYWGSSALEGVLVESSDEFTESALFNFLGFSWFICPINGGNVEEAKRLCLRALALKLGWRFACLLKWKRKCEFFSYNHIKLQSSAHWCPIVLGRVPNFWVSSEFEYLQFISSEFE